MRLSITLSLLLSSFAVSGIPVDIDGKVSSMADDFKNGNGYTHRSGLKGGKVAYQALGVDALADGEVAPNLAMNDWNTGKCLPFILEYDQQFYGKLASAFKRRIGTLADQKEKIKGDELVIEDSQQDSLPPLIAAVPDTNFDFTANIEDYKSVAQQAVVGIGGAVEYDNFEITHVEGAQTTVSIRFRRIFRGGVVRGDASYIYVGINRDKRVTRVRAKWPMFKTDAKLQASYSGRKVKSLDEVMAEAKDFYTSTPDISNSVSVRHPLRSNVQGMSLAWIPEQVDGRMIIRPGYSFTSDVHFEGGVVLHPYSDVFLQD